MPRRLFLFFLVLLAGCANASVQEPSPARAQLEAQHIRFDNNTFVRACAAGELSIVRLFLEAGIDPETAAYHGRTALIEAASAGHLDVVSTLLQAGANPNARRGRGFEAIFDRITYAINYPEPDLMEGATPLIHAAKQGHTRVAETLLQAGANPLLRSADSTSALMATFLRETEVTPFYATTETKNNDHTLLRLLRDAGATEDPVFGLTPLMLATLLDERHELETLLREGADPNATLSTGTTLLMIAAVSPSAEPARLLLEAGAIPQKGSSPSALLRAVMAQHEAVARLLLQAGADPNYADQRGRTPLFFAAGWKRTDLLQELLAYGADASTTLRDGSSALFRPALEGRTENVRLLLEAGAKPNKQEESAGASALMLAVCNGHLEVARLLLNAGANPLLVSKSDQTAAHFARSTDAETILPLLRRGSASPQLSS